VNKTFGQADPKLEKYVYDTFAPEDDLLRDVRGRQQEAGLPDIQVGMLDGLHLEVLARAFGAKKIVEIGTLGGYSGTCLLRGAGDGAHLHTFELDPKHAAVARETFAKAGFGSRAVVHVGAALDELPSIEGDGPFDLVFIDADKTSYPAYLDWAGANLRVGGAVLGDNAFLFGRVIESPETADVKAMRAFHEGLVKGRFRSTMLPTGEGLALGVKIR
jgi:caffeoyl-CoA O-methyltransferase